MLEATDIIKRPLVTEKGTWEGQRHNRYSFEVDFRARKPQIKAAVQQIYSVRVVGVATQIRQTKTRKTRYGAIGGQTWKKATVQLHPDDKIEVF
jgi:large subunit ribosomal protein L23